MHSSRSGRWGRGGSGQSVGSPRPMCQYRGCRLDRLVSFEQLVRDTNRSSNVAVPWYSTQFIRISSSVPSADSGTLSSKERKTNGPCSKADVAAGALAPGPGPAASASADILVKCAGYAQAWLGGWRRRFVKKNTSSGVTIMGDGPLLAQDGFREWKAIPDEKNRSRSKMMLLIVTESYCRKQRV